MIPSVCRCVVLSKCTPFSGLGWSPFRSKGPHRCLITDSSHTTCLFTLPCSPILYSLLSWIERFHIKIQISGFFHKTGWSGNSGPKSPMAWSSVVVAPSTCSLLSPTPPSLCPSIPHSFSGQMDMGSSALSLMTISLHVS